MQTTVTNKINSRVSQMAEGLIGSEILKIAAEIRELVSNGNEICNLTVGDFNPKEFPIPKELEEAILRAYQKGETNYPPSNGIVELRKSVVEYYKQQFGLSYDLNSVLIAGGARPVIYATYAALLDPGDKVIYAAPSWNNNHYCHLIGAKGVCVSASLENYFLISAKDIEPHLAGTRLLALCSPQNPTGTVYTKDALEKICDLVLEENLRRSPEEKPLMVMYDQVYWMITFGKSEHYNPVSLRPELKNHTIFVDAISKAFASTGLRVGWGLGPADVIDKMSSILGHIGAWAPHPEQVAVTEFLMNRKAIESFVTDLKHKALERLNLLYDGFMNLKKKGFSIDAIPPQGAIYLTAKFDLQNKKTPDGKIIKDNYDIAEYLLHSCGLGIVPFEAFAARQHTGWFRLSVGTVSVDAIKKVLPRLEEALGKLK